MTSAVERKARVASRRRAHPASRGESAGRFALLLAAGVVALAVGAASAFELERVEGGPCNLGARHLFWKAGRTSFSVASLGEITAPLAREEAQAWNGASAFTFVEEAQRGFCDPGDGVISMGFADRLCNGAAFGPDVLAVTSYRFSRASGEFAAAEIVFNSGAGVLADEASFRHVALHEMGHVVGLDHADACGEAGEDSVMKAVLRRGDPRFRAPGADDAAGADFLYPPATPTTTATRTPGAGEEPSATGTPAASGQTTSAAGSGCRAATQAASGPPLGALAAGALLWRLRKRRTGHLQWHRPRSSRQEIHPSGSQSAADGHFTIRQRAGSRGLPPGREIAPLARPTKSPAPIASRKREVV